MPSWLVIEGNDTDSIMSFDNLEDALRVAVIAFEGNPEDPGIYRVGKNNYALRDRYGVVNLVKKEKP